MTVETVLIAAADDEGGLARVAVEGDVVGDEAVPETVLRWASGLAVDRRLALPVPLAVFTGNVVGIDQ